MLLSFVRCPEHTLRTKVIVILDVVCSAGPYEYGYLVLQEKHS